MSAPHSRSTLALLAACALLMSACGAESQQEGPSEPLGESQQTLVNNQQVKIRCDNGNCANGQERCLYVDTTTLVNGNPLVKLWTCNPVGGDARFHWTTFYNSATGHWRVQNHATYGCLYADPTNRSLVTTACNSAVADQNWIDPVVTTNFNQLKNLSGRCANPTNNLLTLGTAMHDWPCGTGSQDWAIEPLFIHGG